MLDSPFHPVSMKLQLFSCSVFINSLSVVHTSTTTELLQVLLFVLLKSRIEDVYNTIYLEERCITSSNSCYVRYAVCQQDITSRRKTQGCALLCVTVFFYISILHAETSERLNIVQRKTRDLPNGSFRSQGATSSRSYYVLRCPSVHVELFQC